METDWETFKNYLEQAGSIASILGLVVTVFVYFGLSKIRRFYIYTARVPELNEKLEDVASQISEHLNLFEGNTTKTFEILAHAEVILKSLRCTIKGPINSQIKHVLNTINTVNGKRNMFGFAMKVDKDITTQRSHLESVYVEIYKIVIECKEDYEASRWEK